MKGRNGSIAARAVSTMEKIPETPSEVITSCQSPAKKAKISVKL